MKKKHHQAIRTTVSMPPMLWEIGHTILKRDLYGDFSSMLQGLIRERARTLGLTEPSDRSPHHPIAVR
jgi:hypothetical protein